MTRRLSPEEEAIWHRVARTVTPRPGQASTEPAKKPSTKPPVNSTDGAGLKTGSASQPSRAATKPAPANVSAEKRVRRGKLEIEGRIDLHGLYQDDARAALLNFVTRARSHGKRVILAITGKGRGGDGVIRRRFTDWLSAPEFSEHVSGYATAHARHGGGGAFYVKLRRLAD